MKMPFVRQSILKVRAMKNSEEGQMTVEFAVVFPILIIVAVIAVNALLFFSECARFDQVSREAIRIHATSPAFEQTAEQSVARIEQSIQERIKGDHIVVSVSASGNNLGLTTYIAHIEYSPTLFGMGLRSSVFGVSLPRLHHNTSLTVDTYKPGIVL